MNHRSILFLVIGALALSGCRVNISQRPAVSATPFIATATLPPSPTVRPSETPLPPPPQPTAVPVEGVASTQINVRAQPSTASDVLGILPANTKVQIVGRDPGGNWLQIIYPQGADGKGWVTAQYVSTAGKPEVPVIGGDQSDGAPGIIREKLNVRSGPGSRFNSIGILNPQDVVDITGKDANGVWLQIDFQNGPDGKGWISAAFVQADGIENLPIVTEAGLAVGTGTPTSIPLPPTPTVLPAPMDGDSAESPAVDITLMAAGSRSFQYSSDVSSPEGDNEDWIRFTSHTATTLLKLDCASNRDLSFELIKDGTVTQTLACGTDAFVSTAPGSAYLVHIRISATGDLQYARYTLTVAAIP